ncbi:U4/U6.U5 tri-snRNP-associated protein 1 [Phytophthora citrophthora]|uniref:U4/U6.U5 tri-snRNP-associated protein 1 n=1 Tax=Phytophthora citrophthora TaxID=4793 RepID=A0AAD9GS78_9STRA|nr:U4/U6.U5 tri-snRNP-associated protein 1 [Phytophthora citrophthora]
MARSRSRSASRSPTRSRRHGSSSRRDRHASSRRRSRSRSRHRDEPREAPAAASDEKNGEISLSIEETNKLRVSLGLKPLSVGPSKKEQAVVNVQKTSAQLDAEREQKDLKKKLQQSKTRRELTQKLAGKSLGEQLKADLETKKKCKNDALEWVKRSREKKVKEEKGDEKTEENYDAAALAGMTVGHSLDTFEDGQEVVLTLKDQRVLGEDGKDLNEEDDELVNVELSEKDRRMAQQARAKRAAMPVYSGYDDDEFIEMGVSRKKKTGPKLLAQYDEEQDAVEAEEARKFKLDASGGSAAVESESKREEEDDVAVISLAMDKTKRAEDYYTKEEVEAQFAKHKKNKKLRKKKKKSRRRHDEDLGENDAVEVQLNSEEGGNSASLVAQLEQEALKAGESRSKDRGRRKRNRHDDIDAEEEENLLRFQEAREKANSQASEALAASSGKKKMKRRPIDDSEIVDDAAAIEMELGASLARARQVAQYQTQNEKVVVAPATSEDRIAQLVSQTISREEDTTPVVSTDSTGDVVMDGSTSSKPVGHVFGDVGTTSNTVVFNEATDFETRLRDAMEKRAAQFQVATGTNVPTSLKTETTPQAAIEGQKQEEKIEIDEEMKEENNEDEETKENEVWGEEQPLVGSGMGATLALLRKTGDLRQTRVERQAGRANDSRDRNFEDDLRVKNGVKLDYRDEFGRLLTKKEAFRMLSYKFHGHEPGKKKKEKRLRQLKEELEAQKMLSGEGSTKIMKVLEKKQKHSKEAHVVLSSGV